MAKHQHVMTYQYLLEAKATGEKHEAQGRSGNAAIAAAGFTPASVEVRECWQNGVCLWHRDEEGTVRSGAPKVQVE